MYSNEQAKHQQLQLKIKITGYVIARIVSNQSKSGITIFKIEIPWTMYGRKAKIIHKLKQKPANRYV